MRDNPRDAEAWQVLSDWLLASDDPRGRLAVAEGDAASALLSELAPEWFGRPVRVEGSTVTMREDLSEDWAPGVILDFRHGHVARMRVETTWDGMREDWGQSWMLPLLTRIVSHPVGQLITEMEIRATPYQDFSYRGLIEAITSAGPLAVRRIYVGDDDQLSWTNVPDCRSLWRAAPFLEQATLEGSWILLGTLDHQRLRQLRLISGGLPAEPIRALVEARLPALSELELWFGSSDYGAECRVETVQPLLRRDLPALRRVGLRNCEFVDELVGPLLGARWLPQLQELDLSKGILRDAGAERLLASASELQHLQRLDLRQGFLSEPMVQRLQGALGPVVDASDQRRPYRYQDNDPRYYVCVGE